MVDVILVANYSPEGSSMPMESFYKVVDKSYAPMIQILEDTGIPMVHCFSGHALELFQDPRTRNVLQKIGNMIGSGQAEIALKGLSDAQFSHLTESDILEQISCGQDIIQDVWSKTAVGLFPSEGWIDPFVVSLLKESGIAWAIISGSTLLNLYSPDIVFKPLKIRGLNNQTMPVLCTFDSSESSFSQNLSNGLLGKGDIKSLVAKIFQYLEKQRNALVLLEFNMQIPFFAEEATPATKRFQFFLQCIQKMGDVHFSLPSPLLEKYSNADFSLVCYDIPYQRRLQILIEEARAAIVKAQQKDPDTIFVKKAWRNLLLAESYAGLSILNSSDAWKKGMIYDALSRYIECCERAWTAKKQILEAEKI